MPDISNRYTFRGLLADLSPEITFGCGRPGQWGLTVFLLVPHRDSGNPFWITKHHTFSEEPSMDDVDAQVRQIIKDMLTHEVDESLGVGGSYLDTHQEATRDAG